jgi:hypothetical protein
MTSIWRRVPESGQKRAVSAALPDFGQGFATCAWRCLMRNMPFASAHSLPASASSLSSARTKVLAAVQIESAQGEGTHATIVRPLADGAGGKVHGQA